MYLLDALSRQLNMHKGLLWMTIEQRELKKTLVREANGVPRHESGVTWLASACMLPHLRLVLQAWNRSSDCTALSTLSIGRR